MSEEQKVWPDFFPANCPNPDIQSDEITVFRAIKSEEPTPDDFLPYKLMYPEKSYDDDCISCGLSVFIDIKDLIKKRKRIPGFRKQYKYTAKGNITKDSGVFTPTYGGSHITWWVYLGFQPHMYFKKVQMER